MEKTALAQEKVWFDKPSYDKAERLYFERMAKVVSPKIMESSSIKCGVSITNSCEDIMCTNSISKKKSEKSKDNKSLVSQNVTNDNLKNSMCQTKSLKIKKDEDDFNVPKKEYIEEKQKHDGVKNDMKETNTFPSNDTCEKYNAKEVKEKKNKADTRHRNKGKEKYDTKEVKENVTPLLRNKHQSPNQGNQQTASPILPAGGSLANEVAKARQHIKQSLQCMDDIAAVAGISIPNEIKKETLDISSVFQELKIAVEKLEERVKTLEDKVQSCLPCPRVAVCPAKPYPAPKQPLEKEEDDEDVDLFGSDSEASVGRNSGKRH